MVEENVSPDVKWMRPPKLSTSAFSCEMFEVLSSRRFEYSGPFTYTSGCSASMRGDRRGLVHDRDVVDDLERRDLPGAIVLTHRDGALLRDVLVARDGHDEQVAERAGVLEVNAGAPCGRGRRRRGTARWSCPRNCARTAARSATGTIFVRASRIRAVRAIRTAAAALATSLMAAPLERGQKLERAPARPRSSSCGTPCSRPSGARSDPSAPRCRSAPAAELLTSTSA